MPLHCAYKSTVIIHAKRKRTILDSTQYFKLYSVREDCLRAIVIAMKVLKHSSIVSGLAIILVLLSGIRSIAQDGLPPCSQRPSVVILPRINYQYYCLEYVTQAQEGRPFAYTALAYMPDGTLYAARPLSGQVLALRDGDGDGLPEQERVAIEGLTLPNALYVYEDALYIAGGPNVYRWQDGELFTLVDDLPTGTGLWTGGLAVYEDRLYVGIGANCDDCIPEPERGLLLSFDMQGSDRQVVADGVRQPAALTVYEDAVWFSDIMPADDLRFPQDEINRLVPGGDYGYFACAEEAACTGPMIPVAAGFSPMAMLAYEGAAFPNLQGTLLVLMGGAERTSVLRGPELVTFRPSAEGFIADALFPYDPLVMAAGPFLVDEATGYLSEATTLLNQRGVGFWPQRLYGLAASPEGWLVFSVSDGRLMALRPR